MTQLITLLLDSKLVSVLCHFGNFGCGDGGWTPVMKMDGNKVRHLCTFSLSLRREWKKNKYRFASVSGNFHFSHPVNTAESPRSSSLGTSHQEERLHLSDRNFILMT